VQARHPWAATTGGGPVPASATVRDLTGREFIVTAERLLDGRYQTERLLGTGGMAAVWSGRDLRLDRPVAIKELSGDGLSQPMALERFNREARAVGRLSHPNVVSVYDFGTQDGDPYLVMELVEGPTVARLLNDGPLPVADVLAIASQICDGLAAAHAAGIIHRDIKPANLILTPTGVVKICDFGVARLLDTAGHADLTRSAAAMGSPMYMAPEQINGGPVDPRTDLYALGCTMYAMLAGSPPFSTGGSLSIAHEHITRPPEPLRARRPEVPPQVEALVADLLAKTPNGRPSDAAAVRARIAAMIAEPAIPAAPSTLRQSAVPDAMAWATAAAGGPASPAGQPAPEGHVEPAEQDADETKTVVVPSPEAAPASTPLVTGNPPSTPTGGSPSLATRRRVRAVAAVVAAVAVLAIVILALRVFRSGPEAAAERPAVSGVSSAPAAANPVPSAVPAPSIASSPKATLSPSAFPSAVAPTRGTAAPPTQTAPPPPADPIVALRQAIQQQVDAGNLNTDTARDLNHMVDDLAKSITTDNTDDEAKKLKALRDKLNSLYKEGKLSAEGYRVLSADVDQLGIKLG
jgi:serine/threonine protein kinase/polyhydroxyalkanoate synthesis regulator phasin